MKDAKLHLALVGKRLLCLSTRCSSKDVHMDICSAEEAWRGKRVAVRHSSSVPGWATEGRRRAHQVRATVNSAFKPRLIAVQIKCSHPIIVKRPFWKNEDPPCSSSLLIKSDGETHSSPSHLERYRSMQQWAT